MRNQKNIITHILLYSIALAIVAIITTIKHASFGFDEKTADWIVSPFYNDHTAYGCALAMFIPVVVGIILMKNINSLGIISMSTSGFMALSNIYEFQYYYRNKQEMKEEINKQSIKLDDSESECYF